MTESFVIIKTCQDRPDNKNSYTKQNPELENEPKLVADSLAVFWFQNFVSCFSKTTEMFFLV